MIAEPCQCHVVEGEIVLGDGFAIPQSLLSRSTVLACMIDQGDGEAALPVGQDELQAWIDASYSDEEDLQFSDICTAAKVGLNCSWNMKSFLCLPPDQ